MVGGGAAVLRLSARAAEWISEAGVRFEVVLDWLPQSGREAAAVGLRELQQDWTRKEWGTISPFPRLPQRMWARLAGLDPVQHNGWMME